MARVRGSFRLAPPPRVVKDADTIFLSANTTTDELRVARQTHRSTAAFTNPFTQQHVWTENWCEGRQPPGGNIENNHFSNDNTQAMDWSQDNAEEKWKQARKIREELRAPTAATLALMNGRFSDDKLPEARYEELEKKRSNHEIQFMDGKGALAKPRSKNVDTNLDAIFQTALGTPVIFPANDSDSEDDNSLSILCLHDHHIGNVQHRQSHNNSSDNHPEHLNTNVAVQEAKNRTVRRNTNGMCCSFWETLTDILLELYDATKSATQSFSYQQRAVRRREDLHNSISDKDEATEHHRPQKIDAWPVLTGLVKKDEDELAFEALGAQITATAEEHKTYVLATKDFVRYGEPEDDFEVAWCERFAGTVCHADNGGC